MFTLAGNAILLFLIISNTFNLASENLLKEDELTTPKQIAKREAVPTEKLTPILTNTPTPLPSVEPTNPPTPTIIPELIEVVVEEIKEEIQTEIVPSTNDGSILDQINDFRASKGLAPLSSESNTCSFANTRANEITSSFNHDGFSQRIDSNSLPYPSYTSIAENIAMNPDPNAVVPGWIASSGHNENMSKNIPFGCVGRSGQYYVLEVWAP